MLLLGRLVNTFSYTRMFNLLIINQRLDFRISKRKVKNCVKNIRGPINVLPSETNVIAFPVKNMQGLMIIGLHCILYFFFFYSFQNCGQFNRRWKTSISIVSVRYPTASISREANSAGIMHYNAVCTTAKTFATFLPTATNYVDIPFPGHPSQEQ